MCQSCCARRRVVMVALAFSFAALLAPAPSLFADQTMYFQVANYPASQDQYYLSGTFEWDLTANAPGSSGSYTITPPSGTPITVQFGAVGWGGVPTDPIVVQVVNSNEVGLALPVGQEFFIESNVAITPNAALSWFNGYQGNTELEGTTDGFQNILYQSAPSPLDAFGLPSNGPWIIATASYLPGDVNFDGIVNGLDIADVASHWLQSGLNGGIPGDANYDGVVNGLDISVIASHWLATSAGGSGATVPEPSTIILAVVGGLALFAYRRRR